MGVCARHHLNKMGALAFGVSCGVGGRLNEVWPVLPADAQGRWLPQLATVLGLGNWACGYSFFLFLFLRALPPGSAPILSLQLFI